MQIGGSVKTFPPIFLVFERGRRYDKNQEIQIYQTEGVG